jgi:hypothetical protein
LETISEEGTLAFSTKLLCDASMQRSHGCPYIAFLDIYTKQNIYRQSKEWSTMDRRTECIHELVLIRLERIEALVQDLLIGDPSLFVC